MSNLRDLSQNASAWPFAEAREVLKRIKDTTPEKGYVLFETGYGPSGLPHIGTFGEVARTSMVRHAFEQLSDIPTKLIAFSDDMDGFRKVPTNLPNQEMLAEHLNLPLTQVPDPFGTHESLGHHNNARLRVFLDSFGFEYDFKSSTEMYKAGTFDDALMRVLACYDEIMAIMLPTLGEDRRKTYSPFLPVCPKTGHVLQVPILERNAEAGTIVFEYEDGSKGEVPITGGHCKLQWKPDWAMRWHALDVDYEMSGKDLIDSVKQSGRIRRALGSAPPVGFSYELFLDDNGEKISKSKGNGLAVEEWLRYAPPESLSLFMFQKPKTAKRLFFDVIPKAVDEYLSFVESFPSQELEKQIANPAWHIHTGNPPHETAHMSFNILLNLASVCHSEDKSVLWHFISRYRPGVTAENAPILDDLVGYAIRFYQDFVRPSKEYRSPSDDERQALTDLVTGLEGLDAAASAEDVQSIVYEIGKRDEFPELRAWFKALYEILLGQSQGPRMGSFIALYGIEESITLIRRALACEDLSA
ncbi:MAG: lysine--tRNA ligase [Rhodospirillales bacterium]|jgi:lysyl-tRNA synthetase, class I|nr:lysine--tRNA ligase [Rhodospirillales bacterium]MBT4040090.1 lysine--tRNA ligase [Rhodospirillales bacterium]MBT4627858.1 lysine--tRNA ligase [Rhodospirillales bacterium]MBT5351398.1 lysine--tRNA ligase [Rhodospirillales bacterium]MBT5522219.1 lysine--tRNA ligase [Rhodospirillales bacterium]